MSQDQSWDFSSLADLAILGHLAGERTLLGGLPLPPSPPVPTFAADSGNPVDAAIDALLSEVDAKFEPSDAISMSAGFDSRLILAACLRRGLKPPLVVMGGDRATDVVVAKEIARSYDLEIEQVPLTGERMLADRHFIARTTGGSKTIDNWHTYEYAALSRKPAGTGIWIGSNGEYARTFYFDKGVPFYLANLLGPLATQKFWEAKARRTAIPDHVRGSLTQEFQDELRADRFVGRMNTLFGQPRLGELNDEFYRERVRQFIGNGLRLVSTKWRPKTPFTQERWTSAVQAMPRFWKLGNRWHRNAINRLYPDLLRFPTDAGGRAMDRTPRWPYWLGIERHASGVPYFDYGAFFRGDPFRTAYARAIPRLASLFRGGDYATALAPLPTRAQAFFAALAFYRETVEDPPSAQPSPSSPSPNS